MPSYIIKATPTEDFYVMWSTVVDAPTRWGTRAEIVRQCWDVRDVAPERFVRANENGTSAAWPDWPADDQPYGWSDEGWMVRECIPHDDNGAWVLPRANLRAFCEALGAQEDARHLLTLEPYDDEPTPAPTPVAHLAARGSDGPTQGERA